jgi:hypothetical protein
MARHSKFSQVTADKICDGIAEGRGLRAICEAEDMPHAATIIRWLKHDDRKEFRAQYALAREEKADTFVDEIVQIADDATDAQLAKVQIDARKWAASRLAAKKYGDRVMHAGDDAAPLQLLVKNYTFPEDDDAST